MALPGLLRQASIAHNGPRPVQEGKTGRSTRGHSGGRSE